MNSNHRQWRSMGDEYMMHKISKTMLLTGTRTKTSATLHPVITQVISLYLHLSPSHNNFHTNHIESTPISRTVYKIQIRLAATRILVTMSQP